MKIRYTTKNNKLQCEIDADTKEAFKQLAEFQEVFDEPCCQLCKNDDLQFIVRTVDGNDFYEMKCTKCFAKLAFGQHKVGNSLFPKRKIGESYETQGWHKWNG